MYANVDNLMEVSCGGTVHYVLLAVPTGLFTLMQDVLKVPPEQSVSLSLDEIPDGKFVFSLMQGDTNLTDLWTYSERSMPAWITNPERTVKPNTPMLTSIVDK